MTLSPHQKNALTILGIVVVVVLAYGVWHTTRSSSLPVEGTPRDEHVLNDTLREVPVGGVVEKDGYTIERLPDAEASSIPTPNLARAVPVSGGDIEGSARTQAVANLTGLTESLSKEPENFNGWLLLGVYRNLLGDYQGAREAWEYVTKRYPQDWQAFSNLGSLFSTHLANYPLAESNLKKSIALKKDNPETYRALYAVYKAQGKMSDAGAILEEGIRAVPNALDLVILLARHYRDVGSVTEARTQYDRAIAGATALGNLTLVSELQAEQSALP